MRALGHARFFLFLHSDVRAHCFGRNATAAHRRAYAEALAAREPYAVHLANRLSGGPGPAGGPGGDQLEEGTLCHYLLTRYCVLCDLAPRPPPRYPLVEAGGALVELP